MPFKRPLHIKLWLTVNKLKAAVVGGILAVVLLISCILIPAKSYDFKTMKLSRIDVGDSVARVERVLGSPTVGEYEPSSSEWEYYGGKLADIYEDMRDIEREMVKLEEAGKEDSARYEKLEKKALKLVEKAMEIENFEVITVSFDAEQKVTGAVYRKVRAEDILFGGVDRDLEFEQRKFTFKLRCKVNSYISSRDGYQVKTRYENGAYSLVTIPESEIEKINLQRAGTYKIEWDDPITGRQNVEIEVVD